ncbi:MAG: anaerobic ribonucleoside-triphosphate reductase activating protein [Oscillospiraceae bacterium]|nr:anaerobic ribonucleoside-triphosphate reductase activating protein [Oscillospiraceae bacterium]
MLDLAGIVEDSIVDGPGIRATVFCQGCPHHCEGCHNPETWEFGRGTKMEVEKIAQILRSNPLCRGVTFSGGEPFTQPEGFAKLARILKDSGYEVASYSGYTYEQLLHGTKAQRELLETIDILIDGPFILSQKTLETPFRGSRNQRIIDVKKSLILGSPVEVTKGRWIGEY